MGKEDGREARKDASRARLIEAGFALLNSDGAEALTMRGLAVAAKMAPATAYNVFGSKQALFEAMFNHLNDRGPEGSLADLPGDELDKVIALTDQITSDWINPNGPHRVLFEASKTTATLASILLPKVVPRLITLVGQLQTTGLIMATVPAEDLANRIAFANAGLFEAWLGGRVSDAALGREHRLNLLVILSSVAAPESAKRFEIELTKAIAEKA